MTPKIEEIWNDLEAKVEPNTPFVMRGYSSDVLPDLYVAICMPEKMRSIAIRLSHDNLFDLTSWNVFRDIKLVVYPSLNEPQKSYLLITLVSNQHREIFSILCEDLIYKTKSIVGERLLIDILLNRLAEWKTLFEQVRFHGLSMEKQRGLYGELFLLRKFLKELPTELCVNSWLGPEKYPQDFHHGSWGLEVKTTHGNNHQKVHISSERQLDNSNFEKLFLYHLSLDVKSSHGETLNSIVDDIMNIISGDARALSSYKVKLLEFGYFNEHRQHYVDTGYQIRDEDYFSIFGDFPRLTESMIPSGVGDIKYSIVLSDCSSWKISQNEVIKVIKAHLI